MNSGAFRTLISNGAPAAKLQMNQLGVGILCGDRANRALMDPASPLRVGFIGRLARIKEMFDLLRAIESLPRDLPIDVELRGPINDDESRDVGRRLEELAKRDARISLEPSVRHEKVADVLRTYDVLCCPSTWFENGPTVALEAMAVGTPVIGSRVGVLPDVIDSGSNGALFEPGDWRALARILSDVSSDGGETIRRWREALPPIRTMKAVNDEYMKLYGELRSKRRPETHKATDSPHVTN